MARPNVKMKTVRLSAAATDMAIKGGEGRLFIGGI